MQILRPCLQILNSEVHQGFPEPAHMYVHVCVCMYVCVCFEMFEIILDWQKSCKKSPDVNFLHNHQTFIKTTKLTLLKH